MIPLTTCPNQEDLLQSLSGRLPVEHNNAVADHLETCAQCQETIANSASHDTLIEALKNNDTRIHLSLDDQQRIQRIIDRIQNRLSLGQGATDATLVSNPGDPTADRLQSSGAGEQTEQIYQFLSPPRNASELGGLGKYRILRVLGKGGMGLVFEALDPDLNRRVALKVMKPEWASDQQALKRYLREAQLAASIEHDHIITIYEVSSEHAVPYLAMQLLKGECLQDRLNGERTLSVEECLRIGREIAQGLAVAHARHLIHRDIKPANIWLEEGTGRVKILDFGLARPVEDDTQLTHAGMLIGTPSYMSPEQANGLSADARADLFSLGVVLYRMTTGRLPFPGKTTLEILKSLVLETLTSPKTVNPAVPVELSNLIDQLLAKDRDARPAGAAEVAQRLAWIETQRSQPTPITPPTAGNARRSHRVGWIIAAAASIALLAIIVLKIKTKDGKETEIVVNLPGEAVSATAEIRDGTKTTQPKQASHNAPGKVATAPTRVREGKGANPAKFITLAALDREKIPESERFDWQPEELVAVIGEHRLRHWNKVTQITFHPSGNFFFTVPAGSKTPSFWLTKSLESPAGKKIDLNADSGICEFSQNGKWLITNNQVFSVDTTDSFHPQFKLTHTLDPDVYCAAIHDNRWLIAPFCSQAEFGVWDLAVERPRRVKRVKLDGGQLLSAISWSNDGRRLIANAGNVIRVWDIDWSNPDDPAFTLRDQRIPGRIAVMSPKNSFLATARSDGQAKVELWDMSQTPYQLLHQIEGGGTFSHSLLMRNALALHWAATWDFTSMCAKTRVGSSNLQ